MDDLNLERNFKDLSYGQRVDVVFTIIRASPGTIECCTTILHQKFRTDFNFPLDVEKFAMINAIKTGTDQDVWLAVDDHTTVIPHRPFQLVQTPQIIEACAGIGAVGQGFHHCGLPTSCYIDSNPKFVQWIQSRSSVPVIHGSIADSRVIGEAFRVTKGEQILSGGVSCQPFSSLGDRKEQYDSRSISFPSLLRMGFFLNVIGIVMECTKEVMQSEWAQSILQAFSSAAGFRVSQAVLHLHRTWPSFRTRWWAVVSHPSVASPDLQPMPDVSFAPGVLHLIPRMLDVSGPQLSELECDRYELRQFHSNPKGIQAFILRMLTPMPTATHSWGSQLRACECGCRSTGFASHRLDTAGLYGVLWPLKQTIEMNYEEITRCRHLHPQEVALLCGLNPEYVKPVPGSPLRLDLAGVGQAASPLQGVWVLSQFLKTLHDQGEYKAQAIDPKTVLRSVVEELFHARDRVWQQTPVTSYMEIFRTAVLGILDTPDPIVDDMGELSQEILTAVKEIESSIEPIAEIDVACPIEPVVEFPKEAFDKFILEVSKDIDDDEGSSGSVTKDAIVDDGYDEPHWQCPYDDCFICDPANATKPLDGVAALEPFASELPNIQHEISATLPFTVVEQQPSQIDSPFTSSGGYRAFAKRKAPSPDRVQLSGKEARPHADSGDPGTPLGNNFDAVRGVPGPTGPEGQGRCVKQPRVYTPQNEQELSNIQESGHFVLVFTPGEAAPVFVKMPPGATAGSITVAESTIGTMSQPIGIHDAVGCAIPLGSSTTPFQQIHTYYIPNHSQPSCTRSHGPNWQYHPKQTVPRVDALRNQKAWVACDEMQFYLQEIQTKGIANTSEPVSCDDASTDFSVWLEDLLVASSDSDLPVVSACISNHHWVPFLVKGSSELTHVFTTPEGLKLVQNTHYAAVDTIAYHTVMLPHAFEADCGFQTLGWLGHLLEDTSICDALTSGDRQWIPPMSSQAAVLWRGSFENHLFLQGKAKTLISPFALRVGGAFPQDSPEARVEQLLIQHGVPTSESAQRCQQVVACIGRGPIVQAMRSKQDWAELKALANAQQPRVQLVLPSELASVIKKRAESGKPFGDKKKKQHFAESVKGPLVLQPQDVSIPDGLFKQGEDQLVSQISLTAIRPDASGIVVVSAQQAQPYLKLAKPLSTFGLALLVMEHNDPSFNGIGQVIRFPGRFEKTGEPFIGTGRLIQLGSMEVCRYYPQSQIKVDEVANHVYRVIAYRDEFEADWEDFVQRPIKHVLDFLGFKSGGEDEGVIDVWDRQWLSIRMDRQKPMQADIFQVNLRVTGVEEKQIMARSGTKGYYVEPRSVDGRSPSDSYRVVWLPKTDLANAITSLQAAKTWACLVRAGKRFGLRTFAQDAQQVHDQYKPQTPFLESGAISHYLVGPLPFGATKATLGRVFAKWGWVARPVQPRGRSSDGGGILWEVHASQQPECEAYSMDHGDVIISDLTKRKPQEKLHTDIVASARTIAALHASQPSEHRKPGTKPSGDIIFDSDPWAGYVPAAKVSKTAASSDPSSSHTRQIEAISANVDRKIATAIAQVEEKMSSSSVDATMSQDVTDRVQSVEDRLSKIEQVVQAQHHQMQQQHGHVNTQLTQMQQQIDQQSHSFQEHLDQRMTEQLSQIEKLLGKKGRYE